MTEDASTGTPVNTTEISKLEDYFLIQLVILANQWGIEQGITLTVGGTIISGQLISGKRYFEEQSSIVAKTQVTGIENGEIIRSTFAEIYNSWTKIYDKPEVVPDDYAPPPPAFIHLREALFMYPDGKVIPGNGGILWRGKISAVDGFSIGMMSPS